MGNCFATIDVGQKLGGAVPPFWWGFGGRAGSHLTQCGLGQAYLRTKLHLDPYSRLATIDMGQKVGASRFPHVTHCRLDRGVPP